MKIRVAAAPVGDGEAEMAGSLSTMVAMTMCMCQNCGTLERLREDASVQLLTLKGVGYRLVC